VNADNSPKLDDGSQLDENARADEDSTADTHSDIGVDDCEPASKVLMHYFRAIVAWNEAYKWLDSSKVFRSLKGVVSLNLVKIQVPKQKNASTSIKDILDEFLQKHKADLDVEKSVMVLCVAGFVKLKFTMTRLTDDLMTLRLMTDYDL